MIILRYLAKEMVKTSAAVLLILLLVAILNKFSSLITKAALGEIPPYLVFELIILHIPELLAFLMPLSLFLGMLLALGKLYAEQEMTAYFACGFGWNALIRICSVVSLTTFVLVALLTLWVVPIAQNAKESIMIGQKISVALQSLSPGKFHQVPGRQMVFYFESKSEQNKELEKIFMSDEVISASPDVSPKSIITAQQGKVIEKESFRYLELQKGHQYKGVPGDKSFEILHFEKYGRLLDADPIATAGEYHRNMPTIKLINMKTPSYIAELQWRFSIPLTAPVLAIWGLCLSKVSPRQGRFGKILPAILVFIVYFQLLSASKRWIVAEKIPDFIGLWWVHIVFGGLGLILLLQQSGYWHRKSYAKN